MSRTTGDMVQIHMLTAYPASLLNRDDAGLAKRIPFGEVTRTRVSSQCLKKHWRDSPLIRDLGDLAIRSTRVYERLVAQPLVDDHGATEDEALAIAQWLMNETVDTKPTSKASGLEAAQSGQLLVLTRAETDFLREKAVEILMKLRESGVRVKKDKDVGTKGEMAKDKALRGTLKLLKASIDTALFGRMVTSDLFARVDAAVSVAHAFTTHEEASETDYFTAVDNLKGEADDAGAGLIQDTELTSGVFYLYAVIDMNQLRNNLVGHDAALAEKLARNLVEAMATVTPGAKRGSTAPYSYAEFVLLERGTSQPRTLGNAFLQAVSANGQGLMQESVNSLVGHRSKLERMYGNGHAAEGISTIHPLPDGVRASGSVFELLEKVFA